MNVNMKSNQIILDFLKEKPASTIEEIAFYTKIPFRLVANHLFDLKAKNVVSDGTVSHRGYDTEGNVSGQFYCPPNYPLKWSLK